MSSEDLNFMVSFTMLYLMAALLRMAWQPSPLQAAGIVVERVPATIKKPAVAESVSPADLTPRQKAWVKKAVRKYAAAQEKTWRRWSESLFEPQ